MMLMSLFIKHRITSYNVCYTKLLRIKGADLFELYLTNPNEEPDPSKWITEVYIPVE